jgi:CMP/dCMP kinase
MIITIAGMPGSGKTTVAKIIAEKLDLKRYSIGDLQDKIAQDKGITIYELIELEGKDDTIDRKLDAHQEKLGQSEDNFVMDGRLSWHFIPHSKKVFLTVDTPEAARRIFEAKKNESGRDDEPEYDSIEEVVQLITKRNQDDENRYKTFYGVDTSNHLNYNLVVDTTKIPAKQVAQKILDFVQE